MGWIDTCEALGAWAGPLFRGTYAFNVQRTPWLYEYFYRSLWRWRWFADAAKRCTGSWAGRRLAPLLEDYRPDVVLSTFPIGSSGLSWLRRHRRLEVPTGAWVTDFCPHPFWVYRNLDAIYVMHDRAVPVAAAADPGARIIRSALPVSSAFRPTAPAAAVRHPAGLRGGRFVALLSAGSFGFGRLERSISALLAADPRVQVVVVCGRNQRLRRRLAGQAARTGRVSVLGWLNNMPALIAAADVVLSNAGGVTALEAIAAGRPVVIFDPIAAHGRANGELMADAGAAVLCRTEAELRTLVGQLARDPQTLAALRGSAALTAASRRIPDDLQDLAGRRGLTRGGPVPLRAEDALFLYAQTPSLCQQVGAVLLLGPARIGASGFRAVMRQRIRDVPALRQTLEQPRSRWRRPQWITGGEVDLEDRIRLVTLGQPGTPDTLAQVVDGFFSVPSDPCRSPWQMLLVRGAPGGRTAVVVKVHHTIGDSQAIITTLSRLFDPAGYSVPPGPARDGGRPGNPTPRHQRRTARARGAARALRGVGHLAAAGAAPAVSVCGPFTSIRRRYVPVALPARQVAITARALNTGIADLLLAVTAEALGGLLRARDEETAGRTVRIAMPRARPGAIPPHRRSPGNRSTAISPELPIGPLSPAERLAAVRTQMRSRQRRGEPDGAALVLRAMNLLPPPLQRRVAAHLYQHRWFNMIVSVFPGVRRSHRLLGARVEQVYPVLALADGTGLAIGAMTWEQSLSVGILADAALVPDVDRFAAEFSRAFRRFTAATAG